jgi:hypothetical protein
MQLRLVFLDEMEPPPSPTPTSASATPWEQIDETARMAALDILARLIARMLAAQEAGEMLDE